MKSNKFLIVIAIGVIQVMGSSCVSQDAPAAAGPSIVASAVAGLTNGSTLTAQSGTNVMAFTVNGATCKAGSYPNKPCVSIQVCNPGTATCVTVNDILLDTGSYGLRVFKSALPGLTLTQVTSHQGTALTECAKFGDGSSEWGPIMKADIQMGGETAANTPIQVIDPSFGVVPVSCGTPDATVAAAGFNGIIGVGLFAEDCGNGCTGTHTSNGMYFSCTNGNTGFGASGTTATCAGGSTNTIADQVQNPVSMLPVDNNGVIVQLPQIASSGATSVSGYLIFGIGTESNNVSTGVSKYQADAYGQFTTVFNGSTYDSFLDTGSNGLFFSPPSGLPGCGGSSGWLCPNSVYNYSATNRASDGSLSGTINFQIANASSLFGSGKSAFDDLGGNGGNQYDFGLPIFFGRNVFVGISGKNSGLGTGPYWAY
jgi:hypothetical protein